MPRSSSRARGGLLAPSRPRRHRCDVSSFNLGDVDPPKANELRALLSCLVSLVDHGPFDVLLCLSCRGQDLPVRDHVGLELHSGTDRDFRFSLGLRHLQLSISQACSSRLNSGLKSQNLLVFAYNFVDWQGMRGPATKVLDLGKNAKMILIS